jgi:hypothetical protein
MNNVFLKQYNQILFYVMKGVNIPHSCDESYHSTQWISFRLELWFREKYMSVKNYAILWTAFILVYHTVPYLSYKYVVNLSNKTVSKQIFFHRPLRSGDYATQIFKYTYHTFSTDCFLSLKHYRVHVYDYFWPYVKYIL